MKMDEDLFLRNRERAIDYLNSVEQVFVFDGYAGWHPDHRIKIRVISSRAYHALFMHNMLIRPTPEQLADFGAPDYVIYNSGVRHTKLRHFNILFGFAVNNRSNWYAT